MKKAIIPIAAFLTFFASIKAFAESGEQLFKANCGACHTVGKGKLVGPDLKDVQSRHPDEWLKKWIRSSQSLVRSGDKSAIDLFAANDQVLMPDQNLDEKQLSEVIGFIKTRGEEIAKGPIPVSNPQTTPENTIPGKHSDLLNTFTFAEYIVMMLLGMVMIVIWMLSKTVRMLSQQLHANPGAIKRIDPGEK